MLELITGKQDRAKKVVIYGSEGIGKTSLAGKFPDPVYIDTEGGTAHMDVKRLKLPKDWDGFLSLIAEIANNPGICKTLIIDTADWAELMCIQHICDTYKQTSIESFGYGKGYTYIGEEFTKFLKACDKVIDAGIHVVITAHAKMRKFEQPDETGAYDRWEMKLSKQSAPLLKEWSDLLLFLNYRTYVVKSDNAMDKNKVSGGKRVMYTTHHPCWDAKNRYGLPEVLDLDYKNIAHLFADKPVSEHETHKIDVDDTGNDKADLTKTVTQLMEKDGITMTELCNTVTERLNKYEGCSLDDYPSEVIEKWIIPNWAKIVKFAQERRA